MMMKKLKDLKQIKISIEGNIGSGKSSFINYLAKSPLFQVYEEPVFDWQDLNGINLLQASYENPARNGFAFQSYVLLTMLKLHLKEPTAKFKITERSLLSAKNCFVKRMHQNHLLDKACFEVLNAWFEFAEEELHAVPDIIIYLRTTPETAFERVTKRKRVEEKDVNFNFIKEIHDLHENWILNSTVNKIKTIEVNGNLDLSNIVKEYENCVAKILKT